MKFFTLSDQKHLLILTLFFFLLGSQLFVYHWWYFVLPALFLINWKKIYSPEVLVLGVFLLSVYIVDVSLHKEILHNRGLTIDTLGQMLMILIAYLLGLSVKGISKSSLRDERKIFYLLYGFFIAYILAILYSYYMIPQPSKYPTWGIYVYFENEYQRLHIRDGRLISTIIAYYLTMVSTLIPLLILNFKEFRWRGFTLMELLALGSFALFSIYLAEFMGRRITFLMILIVFLYLGGIELRKIGKKFSLHTPLLLITIIAIVLFPLIYYYFLKDTLFMARFTKLGGFSDTRYHWWIPGLQCMMDHPFGGGYNMNFIPGKWSKLAHNTWIDIGKEFGILAFVSSIIFYLMHIRYLARILMNKSISIFMKNIILIIVFGLFLQMMIEPVFHSEKVYFFYSIFFLGFLKNYADLYSDHKSSTYRSTDITNKTGITIEKN